MKRVAVIAGTSEATELIRRLPDTYEITAFVATEYGGEILKTQAARFWSGDLMSTALNPHCWEWTRL